MSVTGIDDDRSRLLSLAAVVFAIALTLLLTIVPVANNDVWIQMKVGELIADTGKIPDTVLFAFTTVRDNHFNAHEWLPSIVFHELDRLLGLANLMWVVGAFALVQFGLCVLLARRQSGSLGVALLLAMLAMLGANPRYVLRPELFALLYLVWLLLLLERYRTGRRWTTLLWTLALAVLWVNSHGSFLLAPGIVAIFALGEGLAAAIAAGAPMAVRLRAGLHAGLPYAGAVVAMTAACLVNPAGWHALVFPFELQHSSAVKVLIFEWLPTFSPQFIATRPFWVAMGVAAAFVALVVRLRRHLGVTDALLLLVFLAMAMERNRHTVWFGFVALSVCARLVGHLAIDARTELRLRAASAGAALVGLLACSVFGNANHARIDFASGDNFSRGMVVELADPSLTGNVLNSYELGGELIYRDWPRLRPAIDSRVDSYGDDYLVFHLQLLFDENLLNVFLDGNRVNHMLLVRRDFEHNIRNMPSIRANWHIRLTDGDVYLLERNVPLPTKANPA